VVRNKGISAVSAEEIDSAKLRVKVGASLTSNQLTSCSGLIDSVEHTWKASVRKAIVCASVHKQ